MNPNHKPKISVKSFSFHYGESPAIKRDVKTCLFDCRSIKNPGRLEPYKEKTGLDADVQQYLQNETEMPRFLDHIKQICDMTVAASIATADNRDIEILFGCTGGRHRSVYAAHSMSEYLSQQHSVAVDCSHEQQNIHYRVDPETAV